MVSLFSSALPLSCVWGSVRAGSGSVRDARAGRVPCCKGMLRRPRVPAARVAGRLVRAGTVEEQMLLLKRPCFVRRKVILKGIFWFFLAAFSSSS